MVQKNAVGPLGHGTVSSAFMLRMLPTNSTGFPADYTTPKPEVRPSPISHQRESLYPHSDREARKAMTRIASPSHPTRVALVKGNRHFSRHLGLSPASTTRVILKLRTDGSETTYLLEPVRVLDKVNYLSLRCLWQQKPDADFYASHHRAHNL